MFQKIPVELPKPLSHKEKLQSLLHAVGGGWQMSKLNEKLPPLKKQKLRKKTQEKRDEIKINLKIANQNWNDWKIHIHWKKLEWVNPRSRNERKNPVFVSSKILCLKCNHKHTHWVGQLKLKLLDKIKFSKEKIH